MVAAADVCCVNTDHLGGRCSSGGAMCQEARTHRSANTGAERAELTN